MSIRDCFKPPSSGVGMFQLGGGALHTYIRSYTGADPGLWMCSVQWLGGSRGIPPSKCLSFRHSEIDSGAFWDTFSQFQFIAGASITSNACLRPCTT